MADYAYYIGNSFAWVVYLVVGIRLYALSSRSGQISDRLLSTSFLLWAFSYFVYDIPYAFFRDEALIPPLVLVSSMFVLHLGNIVFAFFTRAVFRSRERWAARLVAIIVGCLIVGVAGSVWVGDWGGEYPLSHPWWWFIRVGSAAPYVWMGTEGFAQYVRARKRRHLGLCAPQVCNRFLLWGLAGALWVILELVNGAEYIVYESTGQWSDSLSLLSGSLEAIQIGRAHV